MRASLDRLESQLDPADFVRVHRSAIVSVVDVRGLAATSETHADADHPPERRPCACDVGWAHFLSARKADGLAALERAVALAQGNTLWLGQLGGAYAMAGRTADAQATLRALEE